MSIVLWLQVANISNHQNMPFDSQIFFIRNHLLWRNSNFNIQSVDLSGLIYCQQSTLNMLFNYSIVIVVLAVRLIEMADIKDSQHRKPQNKILSRKRRYLVFPLGSSVQIGMYYSLTWFTSIINQSTQGQPYNKTTIKRKKHKISSDIHFQVTTRTSQYQTMRIM